MKVFRCGKEKLALGRRHFWCSGGCSSCSSFHFPFFALGVETMNGQLQLFTTFFRVVPGSRNTNMAKCKFVNHFGWKRVGTVKQNDQPRYALVRGWGVEEKNYSFSSSFFTWHAKIHSECVTYLKGKEGAGINATDTLCSNFLVEFESRKGKRKQKLSKVLGIEPWVDAKTQKFRIWKNNWYGLMGRSECFFVDVWCQSQN